MWLGVAPKLAPLAESFAREPGRPQALMGAGAVRSGAGQQIPMDAIDPAEDGFTAAIDRFLARAKNAFPPAIAAQWRTGYDGPPNTIARIP